MRLKNRQNYTMVIEVKKKWSPVVVRVAIDWNKACKSFLEMMEMFFTFIQLQAARVCVCH